MHVINKYIFIRLPMLIFRIYKQIEQKSKINKCQ